MATPATTELRPDGKLRLPPGQHLTTGWPANFNDPLPIPETP